MSDRIDELAEAIDASLDTPHPALNDLAALAREYLARALKAEAMCEWLVDITASHAVAANLLREDETQDEYKARLLKAAEEAVKNS